MVLLVTVLRVDFGPMKKHEMNAIAGDLFTTPGRPYEGNEEEVINEKAHVLDLILPVAVLIASCIVTMVYTGGFFEGASFVDAFAASDASVGLVLGGAVTLVFTFIYYMMRDVLSFEEFANVIPEGFQSMIAAVLDPYDGVDVIRHDKPARCKIFCGRSCGKFCICDAGISSDDHFPGCCVSGICNRNILGNIQHSDPDRDRGIPGRTDDGYLHRILSGGCSLRRPLFTDLRHDDHGICRRSL